MNNKNLDSARQRAENLRLRGYYSGVTEVEFMALADAVDAADKALALMKYDLEVAHRVCTRAEEKMRDAVRVCCENITMREKAEKALADEQKELVSFKKFLGM